MGAGVDLVYLDEQEGTISDRKFTAVCGARMPVETVDQFREDYFGWIYKKVRKMKGIASNVIDFRLIPVLHGSDLLREFDDDFKLEATERLVSSFVSHGGRFMRVGYFDETLPSSMNTKALRVRFCLSNMAMAEGPFLQRQTMFISEIDLESLRSGALEVGFEYPAMYGALEVMSEKNYTVDFRRFLGHYFAKKNDIGCQLADIAGYLALKDETSSTDFSRKMAGIFQNYRDSFDFNEVISVQWNVEK